MPVSDEQLRQRPNHRQSQRQPGKPSAHRVEATNALAMATQGLATNLQSTLKAAVESQVTVAKQAAQVAHALETGEIGYAAFQAELANLRQEPVTLTPNWGGLDIDAIMPSSDEMASIILDVCGFAKALPQASSFDEPIKRADA